MIHTLDSTCLGVGKVGPPPHIPLHLAPHKFTSPLMIWTKTRETWNTNLIVRHYFLTPNHLWHDFCPNNQYRTSLWYCSCYLHSSYYNTHQHQHPNTPNSTTKKTQRTTKHTLQLPSACEISAAVLDSTVITVAFPPQPWAKPLATFSSSNGQRLNHLIMRCTFFSVVISMSSLKIIAIIITIINIKSLSSESSSSSSSILSCVSFDWG